MSKHKKTFTIFGLSAAVIILVGAMFVLSQPSKQNDPVDLPDETIGNVAVGGIEGDVTVKEPDVKPDPIVTPAQPEQSGNPDEIVLTKIEDKPEPPELSDTAHTDEPHDKPTDPALTNPAVTPSATPEPVEPTKPTEATPNGGDTNSKGEVYIPGFGWVKDEGGGGQGSESFVDESKLDNIIGH